ncbi:MAG: molybdopterin-dependent oxidoreductase, partial [Bryobacteraceae bacterium]|nr:molybdopterin-dependent oxidoreductase [Bryobacteraceae bacterium]
MSLGRRDLLKFLGGAAAGAIFTPVPWKLIDDVSIWTQNWSWLPLVPKGEIQSKYTTCTLCSSGCPVRVRCAGAQPVSMWGAAGHRLCPIGLSAHHLPYHSRRLVRPMERTQAGKWQPITLEAAVERISNAVSGCMGLRGSLAIVDGRAGTTASLLYKRFVAQTNAAVYIADETGARNGIDLDRTRTLLSLGVPLQDGWGEPGRVMRLQADGKLTVIHAEARASATASLADTWLPLAPGAETAFVLALAHVILKDGLYDRSRIQKAEDFRSFETLAAAFPPERVAAITGLAPDVIGDVARQLAQQGPSVVLAESRPGVEGADELATAVAALNLLIGSEGKEGGILARPEIPVHDDLKDAARVPATTLAAVPDRSLKVLWLDDAEIPWAALERKLAPEHLVISVSSWPTGAAAHAGLFVPGPLFLESVRDAAAPADSAAAWFRITNPLLPAPPESREGVDLLSQMAEKIGLKPTDSLADHLHRRAEAIRTAGRGQVVSYADGTATDTAAFSSADDFWNALANGGAWTQAASAKAPPRLRLPGGSSSFENMMRAATPLPSNPGTAAELPLVIGTYAGPPAAS